MRGVSYHILTAVLGIAMDNIVVDLIYRAKRVPWCIGWGSVALFILYCVGSIAPFQMGIR